MAERSEMIIIPSSNLVVIVRESTEDGVAKTQERERR
jgi:hypothetical protein